MQDMTQTRCSWCGTDPLYVDYHDHEWGVPEWNGRALWEKLILDGFQAGLSWITILRKHQAFRAAFAGFEPAVIAAWGEDDITRLLADPGIVRHRGKIAATIRNAQAFLDIEATEPFADFLWKHLDGQPRQNRFATMSDIPAETETARAMSKDLKSRGFTFCGPTITYAFMQATGMVNDHITTCVAHDRVAAMARR